MTVYQFATDNTNGEAAADGDIEASIQSRLADLRINAEAKRRLDVELRPPAPLPAINPLPGFLDQPDTEVRYRVDRLAPVNSRIILSAQYKAGKTTLVNNLVRALADGTPFLGEFAVQPAHRIVVIDDELSPDMARRWLRTQGIANAKAVADVVCLRGKVSGFNLLDDKRRDEWATRLRDLGCDYLVLDCLRPVLDALGLDESRDAGQFLVAYDQLLADAGIPDSLLAHHMGHANERSRGDSRLQDWPDAIWKIVRETDDPASPRFFTAHGRDVDLPEGRLGFNPDTRHMTYAAGSRGDAKVEAALLAIIETIVTGHQADNKDFQGSNDLQAALADEHGQKTVRAAAKLGQAQGVLSITPGANRGKEHRIAKPCSTCCRPLAAGQAGVHESCKPGQQK